TLSSAILATGTEASLNAGLYRSLEKVSIDQCGLLRSLQASLLSHRWSILALILFLAPIGRLTHRRRAASARRSQELVIAEHAVKKLVDQERLHRSDPVGYAATLPVAQLRDALMHPALYSDNEKRSLWKQVVAIMSRNSMVRESITTLKGE